MPIVIDPNLFSEYDEPSEPDYYSTSPTTRQEKKERSEKMDDSSAYSWNGLFDQLNKIPIADVLTTMYGIEVRQKDDRGYCQIQKARTPSCVIYPDNTWYDFGLDEGGNVIDLVKKFERCDTGRAMKKLGDNFGISLPRNVIAPEALDVLSPPEWQLIGIEPDKASKNINIFIADGSAKAPPYSDVILDTTNPQQVENFKQKYHCPIAEFKKRDPETFAKILNKRSLSPLLADRDKYYTRIFNEYWLFEQVNHDPEYSQKCVVTDHSFLNSADNLNQRAHILKVATRGIRNFNFWWKYLNPAQDLAQILNGKIRVNVSEKSYYALCLEAKNAGVGTRSFEIPYDAYLDKKNNYPLAFERLSHCANCRGGVCTITVSEKDVSAVNNLFADAGIKPAAHSPQKTQDDAVQKPKHDAPPKR